MQWMAWTLPTALFFIGIGLSLAALTLAELKWPTREARGWLPIKTTRGDRFFISLLVAAYVHLTWLASIDLSIVIASVISIAIAIVIMRWG